MISIGVLLIILFGHWLADFVWQPDWMGKGKSSDWSIMIHHGLRITIGMLGVSIVLMLTGFVPYAAADLLTIWAGVNGIAHVAIDAVTSRMTGRYWKAERVHAFFVTIGFDQFLHVAFAFVTFLLFA